MNTKKMAVAGAGLIIAGMGLGAIGVALILPAVVAVTTSAVKRAGERLMSEVERGSIMVGTAAGNLQRSLTDAVTEIRSARSSGNKEAV